MGNQACSKGKKFLYTKTTLLHTQPKFAKMDGSVIKEMIKLKKTGSVRPY
ncbi:hypothetical protein J0A68_20705 [Algoriphagus sp. H41]|uniref:Uncharacterized protein n=1 Tax=Algoriphagus oliviformis TaxID=2811231 RepID=A0ABS3C8G7_9BACT|nr:hypothetical protein [Algoriphagus oliviformis]